MPVIIRSASADDQPVIKAIVRAARLNPMSLDWPRFLIAQSGQDIIGVGQVKPHNDGTRELASIAVVPEWQGQGIGSMIIRALLSREPDTLHLICLPQNECYYARFGFRRISQAEMTPYFRRLIRVARVITSLTSIRPFIVMRRET